MKKIFKLKQKIYLANIRNITCKHDKNVSAVHGVHMLKGEVIERIAESYLKRSVAKSGKWPIKKWSQLKDSQK